MLRDLSMLEASVGVMVAATTGKVTWSMLKQRLYSTIRV